MTSMGGGSGVGGDVQTFQIIDGANVQLPTGVQVDLSTAEGVAQAESELSLEQLADLENLMLGIGYKRAGNIFVPDDKYSVSKERGVVGPSATDLGITELDESISKLFTDEGLPNPYNANTTPQLYTTVQTSAGFQPTVDALNNFLVNPLDANLNEFTTRLSALQAEFPNGNIMEVLFLVFRESIEATNEDKKYFLKKLQEFNTMAEGVSEYLNYLVGKSQELSEKADGKEEPDKERVEIESTSFDLSTLSPPDASGNRELIELNTEPAFIKDDPVAKKQWEEHGTINVDRTSLNDTMKTVESMQETIRNKRQMASTSFQNFDQKVNQLYNLLSTVLKAVNEMRSSTTRNMM